MLLTKFHSNYLISWGGCGLGRAVNKCLILCMKWRKCVPVLLSELGTFVCVCVCCGATLTCQNFACLARFSLIVRFPSWTTCYPRLMKKPVFQPPFSTFGRQSDSSLVDCHHYYNFFMQKINFLKREILEFSAQSLKASHMWFAFLIILGQIATPNRATDKLVA